MKNLKKILIAVAILALLVSTGAVMAIADSDVVYTGQLNRAITYYDAVDAAMSSASSTLDKKLSTLELFYGYVTKTPVSPTNDKQPGDNNYIENYEEEYARIMNGYDAAVLSLLRSTLDSALAKGTPADKSAELKHVYSILAKAPMLNTENEEHAAIKVETNSASYEIAKEFASSVDINPLATAIANYKTSYEDDKLGVIAALDSAYESCKDTTKALHFHIYNCPIDETLLTEEDGYEAAVAQLTAIEAAEIEYLVIAYNVVEDRDDVDIPYLRYHNAIDSLNAYLKLCAININSAEYRELGEAVRAARNDIAEREAAQKSATSYDADIREYAYQPDSKIELNVDFQEGKMPWTFAHGDEATGKNTGTHYEIREDGSNKYLTLVYGNNDDSGTSATHGYFDIPAKDTTMGYVVELDISIPIDMDPETLMVNVSTTENGLNKTTTRVSATFFDIKKNDLYDSKGNLLLNDIVTPGEWTHLTFAYNPEGPTFMLYVDYMPAAEIPWDCSSPDDAYKLTLFRMRTRAKNMSVSYDNIQSYVGTAYRDRSQFNSMTAEEQFAYYVSYASDITRDPIARGYAYSVAQGTVNSFRGVDEMAEYVEMFDSFNYATDVLAPAQAANLVKYRAMVEALIAEPVTTSNINSMTTGVQKANAFVESCGQFMNQASEDFLLLKAELVRVSAEVKRVTNVKLFVQSLERFVRATTFASMSKHAASADSYYELCEFYIAENYELAKSDPVVSAFEKKVGMSMIDYYNEVIGDKIVERAKYENAIRVIDCVSFIANGNYGDGISYEATEEFWETHFEYINKYVLIIRDIVNAEYYDATYPGVDEAVEFFKVIDDSFYELLQKEQVEEMNEQLAHYLETDSYIEKLGICTYLRNYIDTKDIDFTREDVQNIIFLLDVYEGEVETHKDEYANLLDQNTTYFINSINKMDAYVDYAGLMAVYTEASAYYYGMNVDSDEAKAAIAKYVQCEEIINQMVTDNAMFAGFVTVAVASSRADKYLNLVSASAYVSLVDTSIEGMGDYLNTYNEMVAAYNANATAVNAEISGINSIVCAVRTISIPAPVLAIVKKIFE